MPPDDLVNDLPCKEQEPLRRLLDERYATAIGTRFADNEDYETTSDNWLKHNP